MDMSSFFSLLGSSDDEVKAKSGDRARTIEVMRDSLSGDHPICSFLDVDGDGSRYTFSGLHWGVGFANGVVEVNDDGTYRVSIDANQRVPAGSIKAMHKVFARLNDQYKLPGFVLREDGRVFFEAECVTTDAYLPAKAVSLACSTIHSNASMLLALQAGVAPWDLMALYGDGDGSGDDSGDGGDGGLPESALRSLLDMLGSSDGDSRESDEDTRGDSPSRRSRLTA